MGRALQFVLLGEGTILLNNLGNCFAGGGSNHQLAFGKKKTG
jgi:hypothetical protein